MGGLRVDQKENTGELKITRNNNKNPSAEAQYNQLERPEEAFNQFAYRRLSQGTNNQPVTATVIALLINILSGNGIRPRVVRPNTIKIITDG